MRSLTLIILILISLARFAEAGTSSVCQPERYREIARCRATSKNGVFQSFAVMQCLDENQSLTSDGLLMVKSDAKGYKGTRYLKRVEISNAFAKQELISSSVLARGDNQGFGKFDISVGASSLVMQIFDRESSEVCFANGDYVPCMKQAPVSCVGYEGILHQRK